MAGRVGQGYVHEFRAEIAGTSKGVLARLGYRAVQPFGHEFTGTPRRTPLRSEREKSA